MNGTCCGHVPPAAQGLPRPLDAVPFDRDATTGCNENAIVASGGQLDMEFNRFVGTLTVARVDAAHGHYRRPTFVGFEDTGKGRRQIGPGAPPQREWPVGVAFAKLLES